MKNQYEGKTAEQIWDKEWNQDQRWHFLQDHDSENKYHHSVIVRRKYSALEDDIKHWIEIHISEGQYKKGGTPGEYEYYIYEDGNWRKSTKADFKYWYDKFASEVMDRFGKTYKKGEIPFSEVENIYNPQGYMVAEKISKMARGGQYKKGGIPAKKITYKDLVPGSIYKYLHEKGTNVIYSKKGMSGDYIFTDSKDGSWIAISKEEIPTSIAPIKNTVLVKSKNAESFFPDFTQKVSFTELFTK